MRRDLKKELVDQSLHLAVGLAATITVFFVYLGIFGLLHWPDDFTLALAPLTVLAFARGREILQRVRGNDPWHECKSGCVLDMAMWSVGAGIGVLILLLAYY
jgi:hypothetical protein